MLCLQASNTNIDVDYFYLSISMKINAKNSYSV